MSNVGVARPGDTIILVVPQLLDDDEYRDLMRHWEDLTSLGVKIAIAEGVSSAVIVKANPKEKS